MIGITLLYGSLATPPFPPSPSLYQYLLRLPVVDAVPRLDNPDLSMVAPSTNLIIHRYSPITLTWYGLALIDYRSSLVHFKLTTYISTSSGSLERT